MGKVALGSTLGSTLGTTRRAPARKPGPEVRRRNSNASSRPGTGRPQSRPTSSSSQSRLDPLREKLKQKFKALDVNGDGSLDVEELRNLLQGGRKTRLSDIEVRTLFNKVDKNGNGRVEFDEFVDYLWKNGDGDSDDEEVPTFDMELPLGGGGLTLGGKLGNAVVKAGYVQKVKIGWRVVGINGKRMPPDDLAQELDRCNQRRIRTTLTFEMDEVTAEKVADQIDSQRAAAMRDLLEVLGCSDVADVADISDEARANALQDHRIPRLLVQAQAVSEAELLLNVISPEDHRNVHKLKRAIGEDDHAEVCSLITEYGESLLLRKDGDGNVPLHWAKSAGVATAILKGKPGAQHVVNNAGRNPLNERLHVHREASISPSEIASSREALLICDEDGCCAAMRLQGDLLEEAASHLPRWEVVQDALQRDAQEIVPTLRRLAGDQWPGLLGFHCFRDAVVEGSHSIASWSRLRAVWETMERLFKGCLARRTEALDPLKVLLRATKGPRCPPVDMRLPYRVELMEAMELLGGRSGAAMEAEYSKLAGKGADWLKFELQDDLCTDCVPDVLVSRGLKPRLRMDFELNSGEKAADALVPEWIHSPTPDFTQIQSDLLRVGMVGQDKPEDATYDMLRLGGMGQDTVPDDDKDGAVITRLYAAYLRGVCQTQQKQVTKAVQQIIGGMAVPGETMFARSEAKGFPRICVKVTEAIDEVKAELKAFGDECDDEEASNFLRRAAAYVNDINGVTLLGTTPEDLKSLHGKLVECTRLMRVKNTYRRHAETSSGYRDIKVWPCVETDVGLLLVEVQLILASAFQEKKWMHLPYAFQRGDFDWQYTREGPTAEDFFRTGWRFHHGIDGTQSEGCMKKARESLVEAAKRGHFLARGLCYKEGFGSFAQDDLKAMADFQSAADFGMREAICRLGISLVNSMTNTGVNIPRGLKFLQEAAEAGEPEACFQLGLYVTDREDQKDWLEQAVRLGHQRAARHPLMSVSKKTTRTLRNLDV